MLGEGTISSDDLELLVCTDDPAEVERIVVDYSRRQRQLGTTDV